MMWDAIAVTCKSAELASVVNEELEQMQRGGVIDPSTLLIAVEDPRSGIGSGGATINALTVMCEHFCVREGLSTFNFDTLLGKRLLVVHAGRDFPYEPLAGIFLPLPCRYAPSVGCDFPVTSFHWMLRLLSEKIPASSGAGVWVYSGEMLFDCEDMLEVNADDDIVAFSSSVDEATALIHGIYDIDEDGYLREIVYRAGQDRIAGCRRGDGFPLVCGLVFLSLEVAEKLLRLYSEPPLDACTYMGVDSGAQPLSVSLFFTVLACMGAVRQEEETNEPNSVARRRMREAFGQRRVRVCLLPRSHALYLHSDASSLTSVASLVSHSSLPHFLPSPSPPPFPSGDAPRFLFAARRSSAAHAAADRLEELLSMADPPCGLRPLLRWAVCVDATDILFSRLDSLSLRLVDAPGRLARALAVIAELLGAMGCGKGGLRSGPASNPRWTPGLRMLKSGEVAQGLNFLAEQREKWRDSPLRLIRASRHYERASQLLVARAVASARQFVAPAARAARRRSVKVRAPARIDLAGGWSDTPPLCYEQGGAVVNVSVTVEGRLPIGVCVERQGGRGVTIVAHEVESRVERQEQLMDFDNPVAHGALVKATLVFAEFSVEEGVRVETWSDLPQGSGLGTSSIMAAALLTALWTLDSRHFSDDDVVHGVLIVEQMMTTGGGWQDQVGGLGHGFHLGSSESQLPLRVTAEVLPVSPEFRRRFDDRLVLLYSGKTRLAKHLLQDVVRNWYTRDAVITENVRQLATSGRKCRDAVISGDLDALCDFMQAYRVHKRIMATGSETHTVLRLIEGLTPLMQTILMAGAGGGGFLVGILKPEVSRETLADQVESLKTEAPDVKLYDCAVHTGGVSISIEV